MSEARSEIEIAKCECGHPLTLDGEAQAQLDRENVEANADPRGPKEHWREKSVGHDLYGADGHVMTDEDFEREWAETAGLGDDQDRAADALLGLTEGQLFIGEERDMHLYLGSGTSMTVATEDQLRAIEDDDDFSCDDCAAEIAEAEKRRLPGFEYLWDDSRTIDDEQTKAAHSDPRGARQYWREQQVGKIASTIDGHLLTGEEFDQFVWPLWDFNLIHFGLDEAHSEVIMAQSHVEEWVADARTDEADRAPLQSAADQLAAAKIAIEQAMETIERVTRA